MATPSFTLLTSMVPTVLVSTQIAATTDTVVYTVGTSSGVKLTQGSLANISGSAVTVGLSIVPAGGSLDGTHKIIPNTYSLAAGDTLALGDFLKDHYLGAGDYIAVKAGTANAIDVVISGLVIS